MLQKNIRLRLHHIDCDLGFSVPNVRVATWCSQLHGKGFAMNAKVLSVLVVVTIMPLAAGCGSVRNLFHGRGAYCGNCATQSPGYSVIPSVAAPGGCGGPGCGPTMPSAEPVCGTEFGGSYYGGYDGQYLGDGNVIGGPMIGTGVYGGQPFDSYNPSNDWIPSDPNYVPNSAYTVDNNPMTTLDSGTRMGTPTPASP
jgi:hypothetical protein